MPIPRIVVGTLPEDNRQRVRHRRIKLMNGGNETEGHRLFNADRMLNPANHPVVASWMILTMTDGRELLSVAHRPSLEHRLIRQGRRQTTMPSNGMTAFNDSDRHEDRTLKPSSTCRLKRRVTGKEQIKFMK